MRRVRCVSSVGEALSAGCIYEIKEEYTDIGGRYWYILQTGAHYLASRFVDVGDEVAPAHDTSPMFPAASTAVAVEVPFDFDRYNGLKR